MKKKNIISLILCSLISFSLIGCNLKDDYIIQTKENTDEKPSGDKVNEVFDSKKMTELMGKLKTTPREVSDKLDKVDSDTARTMKELNDKVNQLTDDLNSADLKGKSEDIKKQFDDISDKLDNLKKNADDAKDRAATIKNPIDKTKVTDTIDEITVDIDNIERILDRVSSTK